MAWPQAGIAGRVCGFVRRRRRPRFIGRGEFDYPIDWVVSRLRRERHRVMADTVGLIANASRW